MINRVYINCIALGITGLILCGFQTAPKMAFVSSKYSGHEEITRQALNNVIRQLTDLGVSDVFKEADFSTDLDPTPKGIFGYLSKNMLIHGNFATDFPKQTQVLNLAEFWNNPRFHKTQDSNNQVAHFLRNYINRDTVASAKATCQQARTNIKYATAEAIKLWQTGDKTKSLFLLGHATHTIQDSFSQAHTIRDSIKNNSNLKNICFYGDQMGKIIDSSIQKKKGLCFHGMLDSRDVIWNQSEEQVEQTRKNWSNEPSILCNRNTDYPETEEEKIGCLKNEARLARVATEKYLYLVFYYLNLLSDRNIQPVSLTEFTNSLDKRLFDGPVGNYKLDQKMPNGIMRCENLSNDVIKGKLSNVISRPHGT